MLREGTDWRCRWDDSMQATRGYMKSLGEELAAERGVVLPPRSRLVAWSRLQDAVDGLDVECSSSRSSRLVESYALFHEAELSLARIELRKVRWTAARARAELEQALSLVESEVCP